MRFFYFFLNIMLFIKIIIVILPVKFFKMRFYGEEVFIISDTDRQCFFGE